MKDFAPRGHRRPSRRAPAQSETVHEFFDSNPNKRRDHKTAQLCRQVYKALSMALEECGDDVLRSLLVHHVDPAPSAGRMLVRVGFSPASDPLPVAEVMNRLAQVNGFLRHQVAAAITRKRAPELMFLLIASTQEEEAP
jgi:ribosome-binding factor A